MCLHDLIKKEPVIYAVAGYKNSGKTTLIMKLIKTLSEKGLKVATVKHDGHDFKPDVPGSDTYRHAEAGAYGTAIFSDKRWMITKEIDGTIQAEDFKRAFPEADVILIEGLKHSSYPKYMCSYPDKVPDVDKIVEEISGMCGASLN